MRTPLGKWPQILLAVWWVVHYMGGIQGPLLERVDGPYAYYDQCIDAARWYTEHRPLSSPYDHYFCQSFAR